MHVLESRNVHEALLRGMFHLKMHGQRRESRAGDVIVADGPVTTLYQKPTERVVFWPERDCNPFFHFMEGLWMLDGRNDVAWLSQFSSNIAQFSDDGLTFHGAYGYRWTEYFTSPSSENEQDYPINQLSVIAMMLRRNPNERRCVLGMWDPYADLGREGKDVPCNTHIYFKINLHGQLDMTVCNRSNDIIWGAYGANAVHFSMLQEFMAAAVGVPVGRYWQVSNDYHAYVDVMKKHEPLLEYTDALIVYPYRKRPSSQMIVPFPMVNGPLDTWIQDLRMFVEEGPVIGFRDRFFKKVAAPMWNAWFAWKDKDDPDRVQHALKEIENCEASDWRMACQEWLDRRRPK